MNKYFFPIYRILVPKPLRTIILKKNLRYKILNYFASLPENEVNDEQKDVLHYLEKNKVSIFPYPFQDNYSPDKIEVKYDPKMVCDMFCRKGNGYILKNDGMRKGLKGRIAI
jgi:hypothetical protein